MLKKISIISIITLVLISVIIYFSTQVSSESSQKIETQLNQNPTTIPEDIPQETPISETPKSVPSVVTTTPSKSCEELTKDFISEHGYEKSGLNFNSNIKINPKIGCLLNVMLSTKLRDGQHAHGQAAQSFYLNLFNLSDNTVISSYKGTGDGASPFIEEPELLECIIQGTKKYECKSFKEYIDFINRILAQ